MAENEKVIVVQKTAKLFYRTKEVWQYDIGHTLRFDGFDLPDAFQVHFSRSLTGQSKTQIGQDNVCELPAEYTQTSGTVYAWVYVADEDTGLTKHVVEIPVKERGEITDQEPTPVERSVIDQTISALNTAVEKAESAQEAAETAKTDAETAKADAEDAATRAATSATDANASREAADTSATNAGVSERNAKKSETAAAGSASAAAQSASTASQKAEEAAGHAQSISGSVQAAQTAAQTATTKAGEASQSASTASQKAQEAASSASASSSSAGSAEAAKTAAETAKTDAESAKDDAEAAARTAERASGSAGSSAMAASQSASAAARSASDAATTVSGAVATINTARDNAVTAVQTKGDEVLESIPADFTELTEEVSNLNSALNAAPTEETGAELLAAKVAETELLYGLLYKLTELPSDEMLAEIRGELVDEVEWLEVIRAEIEERVTEVA